uniref:Fibronectin type-III domain-containing protein n=1 Tax=Onchocerca volvulus TaxID=6282 RepID=A0A8R1XW39_ONCVO
MEQKLKMNVLDFNETLLAVETNDEDLLRMILSKTDISFDARIDDVYLEKWTLLEFALMLDHRQCAEELLRSGATIDVESCPPERRLQQIQGNIELITEEIRFLRTINIQNEDKQIEYLEKRLLQMKKMKTVLENTIVPGPLANVEAVVSASDQLTVSWKDIRQRSKDLVVNYKVEWSLCDDFNSIEGSLLVNTVMKNYAVISELKHGLRYSVRVSAASIGGFGNPIPAEPQSLLLSNVSNNLKEHDRLDDISKLFLDIEKYRSSPIWQTLFPKIEIIGKKKKRSIKTLFAGSFRSHKVMQRGIYLVSIIYSEMKVCTVEEYLPIILVDQTQFCIEKDEMYWAIKLSLAWDEMQTLQKANNSISSNSHFRSRFIDAAIQMHNVLGVKDIGRVHYQPIVDEVNSVSFIVTVRLINGSQTAQLEERKEVKLTTIYRFSEDSEFSKNFLENPHITKEEWDLLRSADINASNPLTPMQLTFHTALVSAASRLLNNLEVEFIPDQRIYRLQVFQLQFGVSFIILLPKIEDVCTEPSYSPLKSSTVEKDCFILPLQVFEAIHLCTYNPDFIGTYCRLSLFIEHFSTYIQFEQRNSLLEKDINVYADILSKLNEFQHRLEKIWKSMRWVSDVASIARDKQAKGIVSMENLFAVSSGIHDRDCHNKQETRSDSKNSRSTLYFDLCGIQPQKTILLTNSMTEPWLDNCFQPKKIPFTRVIKIDAAYQCGLTCGTSVRFQIAPTTTAGEIVAMVTKQLAKAAAESGKAIESKDPEDFCLAVVVGSRERRLQDDFPLMKLQNPWDEGRLFVRRRDSVLAALQRGNETAV